MADTVADAFRAALVRVQALCKAPVGALRPNARGEIPVGAFKERLRDIDTVAAGALNAAGGADVGGARRGGEPPLQAPLRRADQARAAVQDVVFRAWCALDDTEDRGAEMIVPRATWAALEAAMDDLEALIPEGEQPCCPSVAVKLFWPRTGDESTNGRREST